MGDRAPVQQTHIARFAVGLMVIVAVTLAVSIGAVVYIAPVAVASTIVFFVLAYLVGWGLDRVGVV